MEDTEKIFRCRWLSWKKMKSWGHQFLLSWKKVNKKYPRFKNFQDRPTDLCPGTPVSHFFTAILPLCDFLNLKMQVVVLPIVEEQWDILLLQGSG